MATTDNDWVDARIAYEAGRGSYQNLAEGLCVSKASVGRRALKEGWIKYTGPKVETTETFKKAAPVSDETVRQTQTRLNAQENARSSAERVWLKTASLGKKAELSRREEEVIHLVTEGMSYGDIAKQFGCSGSTIFAWIEENEERKATITRARSDSAHKSDEDAIVAINGASNAFELAKARELAIHYRWRAKARNPRVYGDKQQIEMSGTVKAETNLDEVNAAIAQLLGAKPMGDVVEADDVLDVEVKQIQ